MRKRFRTFIIALSICTLIITNIKAYEIYPLYPKAWLSRTSYNQAALVHYYGNLQSTYSDISIATAYGMWSVNCNGNVYVTNTVTNDPNSSCRIYYMVPTQTFWHTVWGCSDAWFNGYTQWYDSNGIEITSQTASNTTSYIKAANIFIQPPEYDVFADYPTSEKICVVAHEIGHALGFGHTPQNVPTGNTIMDDTATSYTAITALDKSNLIAKYPRP